MWSPPTIIPINEDQAIHDELDQEVSKQFTIGNRSVEQIHEQPSVQE